MKVLVTGGRDFADREMLFACLDCIHSETPITHVIHGGATGADNLADQWAKSHGIPLTSFPADWMKYGKSAGPIRNREMIATKPDLVVAAPGGRGTKNCVDMAINAGIRVVYV
jgi:hypothetical protein